MVANAKTEKAGSKVRIGVIGAGNWGQNLVRNFANLPNSELVYICDAKEATRKKMSGLYPNSKVTDNFDELLKDKSLDGIVIALESPLHFKFAQQSLDAGKHTYIEKPLTLSSSDAKALVDLAKAKKRKLMVGHLLEYHPAVN